MSSDREQVHAEEHRALRRIRRVSTSLVYLGMALGIACGGLAVSLDSAAKSDRASDQSRAACQLYRDISNAPLAPSTTSLGLHIAAGARVAYTRARCNLGPLTPPDARVVAYLPKGMH